MLGQVTVILLSFNFTPNKNHIITKFLFLRSFTLINKFYIVRLMPYIFIYENLNNNFFRTPYSFNYFEYEVLK